MKNAGILSVVAVAVLLISLNGCCHKKQCAMKHDKECCKKGEVKDMDTKMESGAVMANEVAY